MEPKKKMIIQNKILTSNSKRQIDMKEIYVCNGNHWPDRNCMKIQPFNLVHIGVLVIQTKARFLKCLGYLFLWRLQGEKGIPFDENMLIIGKYTTGKHVDVVDGC